MKSMASKKLTFIIFLCVLWNVTLFSVMAADINVTNADVVGQLNMNEAGIPQPPLSQYTQFVIYNSDLNQTLELNSLNLPEPPEELIQDFIIINADLNQTMKLNPLSLPEPPKEPIQDFIIINADVIGRGNLSPLFKCTVCSAGCDYTTIQAAVDDASPGITVEVHSGTYEENVVVDKQLKLVGLDTGWGAPVIDPGGAGSAFTFDADGIKMEGFTLVNSGYGIKINSNNSIIKDNNVSSNNMGIYFTQCTNNTVVMNNVNGNWIGLYFQQSTNNRIYLNNLDNTDNVFPSLTNTFNSTTPKTFQYNNTLHTGFMGNHWSDYTGTDVDGDGIGDTSHSIGIIDKDYHPLTQPFENYFSPVADFTYSPQKPMIKKAIEFNASPSFDPNEDITLYKWDFGDNNTAAISDPVTTYSYTAPACYEVNLTVIDKQNLRDSLSTTVKVGCGDVNCDGYLDISDVIRLLYYVGYPGQYNLCSEWAGDVNGDDTIDISDVIRLLYYVGYPGQYELNCKC